MLKLLQENLKKVRKWDASIIKIATLLVLFLCLPDGLTADLEQPYNEVDGPCETIKCTEIATSIWENMDRSINPCSDFYNYVCGGALRNVTSFKRLENIYNVQENTYRRIMNILSTRSMESDTMVFNVTKLFYRSCVKSRIIHDKNRDHIYMDGNGESLNGLIELLKKLGGWPVFNTTWNEDDFDWLQTAVKINDMGFSHQGFISISITKQKSQYIMNLGESIMYLKYPGFVTNNERNLENVFETFMFNIATSYSNGLGIVGQYRSSTYRSMNIDLMNVYPTYKDEITNAIDFLIEISKSLGKDPPPEEEVPNLMTIKELSNKYPTIPWLEYINKMIKPTHPIDENVIVKVSAPRYFARLEKLLCATPKRTIMNAMIIGVIYASIPYLHHANIRTRYRQYQNITRWRECVLLTTESFPVAVGALYARNYFDKTDKKHVAAILKDVKRELKNLLLKTTWLSDKARSTAIGKLESTTLYLPDVNHFDDNRINKYYHGMEIQIDYAKCRCNREQSSCDQNCLILHQTSTLDMMLKANRFNTRKYYDKLEKSTDKRNLDNYGFTTEINHLTYHFQYNNIEIPIVFLQKPFFDKDVPNYVNYALLGTILGSLATHSWDDFGRNYDKNGQNDDWWDTQTKIEYQTRAACYNQRYNRLMHTPEAKGHGFQTEIANIADHIGLTAAYLAYQNKVKCDGVDLALPSLPLTAQQLFWISAANMFCHEYNWPQDNHSVLNNYSPAKARVLGAFSNIPEFVKDFNCPQNSRMNPKMKCRLL